MALVKIPPTEARVRWDRAANRPTEIRWDGQRQRVIDLDGVRDERAAYPAGSRPRVTFLVRTADGGRAAVAFDGRRWLVEALEPAA